MYGVFLSSSYGSQLERNFQTLLLVVLNIFDYTLELVPMELNPNGIKLTFLKFVFVLAGVDGCSIYDSLYNL